MTYVHLVLFTLRPDATEEQKAHVVKATAGLGNIPSVKRFSSSQTLESVGDKQLCGVCSHHQSPCVCPRC